MNFFTNLLVDIFLASKITATIPERDISLPVRSCTFLSVRQPNACRRVIFAAKTIFMQHEDDLRALAKIIAFILAAGIACLVTHIYWFGYEWLDAHG